MDETFIHARSPVCTKQPWRAITHRSIKGYCDSKNGDTQKELPLHLIESKSGARTAQNRAQQARAENRGDSQTEGENNKKARKNRAETPLAAISSDTMQIAAMDDLVPPRGVEPLFSD